jgi:hypothetical protein
LTAAALAFATALGGCAENPRPCVTLTAYVPGAGDGERVLAAPLANPDASFTMTYIHSVTRTPVTETYRATAEGLVQTAIRFEQHGPGLPSGPAAGERWIARDSGFEVAMQRKLESVVIRVHGDQSPRLAIDGRTVDLARWGNRPLVLDARISGHCDGPLPP